MEISLLPATLEIAQILEQPDHVVIHAGSISRTATCPACGQPSQSLHSRYARAPDDLAIAEKSVTLHLRVRRYRCRNPDCTRVTFAESFPNLISTRARRTSRLQNVQLQVSLAVGAEAGTRLLQKLHASTSPDTLLRLTRAFPIAPPDTPRVLGVDDFSFRRGRIFGTILVDLEKHQVVDVLEDRDSTSFATWLKAHPGVEIISRDRGQIYAQGATEGAPDAVQVADRWHILKNLADAVENWLRRHSKHLNEPVINNQIDQNSLSVESNVVGLEASAKPNPIMSAPTELIGLRGTAQKRRLYRTKKNSYLRSHAESEEKRLQKIELYGQALKLRDEGFSARGISRLLGKADSTILEWFKEGFPKRWLQQRRFSFGRLDEHLEFVQSQIEEAEVSTKQIYWALLERGFAGSLSVVYALVAVLRAGLKMAPGNAVPSSPARYKPRDGVWMFVREPKKLELDEAYRLKALMLEVPEAKSLYDVVQGFTRLLRYRLADSAVLFETWLGEAKASGISEVRRFVQGVLNDQTAILASMRLEWSNGQVEGQVTRLKLIKRFGFGRAKFDLLRARVLLA
jgi:transposase